MLDCAVLVGAGPQDVPPAAYGLDAALDELTTYGVRGALVSARGGASYDQRVSNDEVLALAGSQRGVLVYPVATLNPVQYLEWPRELDRVLAAGAVGLRFHPGAQRWPVQSAAFAEMLGAVRGRCPLFIPVTAFGDATAIGAATAAAGTLVVLVGGHYTQLGDCLAALKRWPHLSLETSRLAHFRAIQTVVREVGAARLLFGTDAPTRSVGAVLNAVVSAAVSTADTQAILSGNATRLLRLPETPEAIPEPRAATHVIDVHQHVGRLGLPTPPVDAADHANQVGIDAAVASSLRAIATDLPRGNAEAFAEVGRSGSTARHAYVVLNPNDPAGSDAALADAYRREVAVGAKIHCGWSQQPTAGSACMSLLRTAAAAGRPVKIHVDGPGWAAALEAVASEFPACAIIVAHGGPGSPARATGELVARTRNVYLELATSSPDLPLVREVVRRAGPDRLLFGSDAPLLEPAYALGLYADAGVDLAATTAVARRVFGW